MSSFFSFPGMNIVNTLPRKALLEILAAVCVYSDVAYARVMEALDVYKVR